MSPDFDQFTLECRYGTHTSTSAFLVEEILSLFSNLSSGKVWTIWNGQNCVACLEKILEYTKMVSLTQYDVVRIKFIKMWDLLKYSARP